MVPLRPRTADDPDRAGDLSPRQDTMRTRRLVLGLGGFQLLDGAFNALAIYDLAPATRWGRWANEWAKEDLDRLRFPERLRFVFPIVKGASAVGLLAGLRWHRLGRVTSGALVAYFVTALGFHVRAKDSATKYLPAVGMLAWSSRAALALRAQSSG
jgi:hypothetical protein